MKPELSAPIPVRVPIDVLADIEAVAKACDRTRSWVMVRALKLYLAGEGADVLAAARGRSQAEAGDLHDMEEALREAERILTRDVA